MATVAVAMVPTQQPIGLSVASLQHSLGRIRSLVGAKTSVIDLEGVHARFSVDVEGVCQLHARPIACQFDAAGTGWLMLRVFSHDHVRWGVLRSKLELQGEGFVFMTIAVKAGQIEPSGIKQTLAYLRAPKHAAVVYARVAEDVLDAALTSALAGSV